MKCAEGDNWRLQDYFPQLVNAFVGRDSNTQFWGLLGDNFYDRDGSVTDFAFGRSEKSGLWLRTRCDSYGLSLETKAKLFLTVPGNHDYWLEGAPVRATSQDQCGNGFVQYYGQDVKAALDLEGVSRPAPYDLSIDPVIPGNPKLCAYTARENSFFYNVVGNIGFIGYSAVHSWESQKADFGTACAKFFADSDVDLVFVLGHWNKQGAGTLENTDLLNTTRLVVESFPSTCGALHEEGRVTFAMGHEHCAHPVVNNYMTSGSTAARTGFLVGSFGMDDWVCPDYTTAYDAPPVVENKDVEVAQDERRSPHTYGFPVFSTEGNRFTVWYFLLKRNGNKESGVDYFDEVLNCLQFERTWKLCTHLAVLWHERELPPRRPTKHVVSLEEYVLNSSDNASAPSPSPSPEGKKKKGGFYGRGGNGAPPSVQSGGQRKKENNHKAPSTITTAAGGGQSTQTRERMLENALLNKETQRRQEREIAQQKIDTLKEENERLKQRLTENGFFSAHLQEGGSSSSSATFAPPAHINSSKATSSTSNPGGAASARPPPYNPAVVPPNPKHEQTPPPTETQAALVSQLRGELTKAETRLRALEQDNEHWKATAAKQKSQLAEMQQALKVNNKPAGVDVSVVCSSNKASSASGSTAPTTTSPSTSLKLLDKKVKVMKKSFELFKQEMALFLTNLKPRGLSSKGLMHTSASFSLDPVTKLARTVVDYRARFLREAAERRQLHNRLQELRGNIRVFCRVATSRSTSTQSQSSTSHYTRIHLPEGSFDEIGLWNDYTNATKTWRFDRVFGPKESNADVFHATEMRDLVTSSLDGYPVCIFAYGPTGSGKTYSMAGGDQDP
eukprot:g16743.t1